MVDEFRVHSFLVHGWPLSAVSFCIFFKDAFAHFPQKLSLRILTSKNVDAIIPRSEVL